MIASHHLLVFILSSKEAFMSIKMKVILEKVFTVLFQGIIAGVVTFLGLKLLGVW